MAFQTTAKDDSQPQPTHSFGKKNILEKDIYFFKLLLSPVQVMSLSHPAQLVVWKGIPCPRADRIPPLPLAHHLPPSCLERFSKWISSPSRGIPAQGPALAPTAAQQGVVPKQSPPEQCHSPSVTCAGAKPHPGAGTKGTAAPACPLWAHKTPFLQPAVTFCPWHWDGSFALLLSLQSGPIPSLEVKVFSKPAGAHRQGPPELHG